MNYSVVWFNDSVDDFSELEVILSHDDSEKIVFVGDEKSIALVNASLKCVSFTGIDEIISSEEKYFCYFRNDDTPMNAARLARGLFCDIYIIVNEPLMTSNLPEVSRPIDKLDFDEALEIISCGYYFLDTAIIEEAKKYGILLRLLPVNSPDSQTEIKEVMGMETSIINGVIKESDICIFTLKDIPDEKGISYKIFKTISDQGIVVDIISLPAAISGKQDISFTVSREDKLRTMKALEANKERLKYTELRIDDNVAKVSIVGAALQSASGVATEMFRVLYENDINVKLINTSDIKISVIIDKRSRDKAVHGIHEAFIH